MRCPRCKGSGVVDTSPAAASRAPWLSSDEDCGWCEGTGDTDPSAAEAPDPLDDPWAADL